MAAWPLATGACLRAGAVGGLFTPTLASGALAGTLAGRTWGALWPAGPVAGFALIGAVALLSAAMQSPIASIALVVELIHGGLALLVPIVLAAAGATVVSRVLVPASLYTTASRWQADRSPSEHQARWRDRHRRRAPDRAPLDGTA